MSFDVAAEAYDSFMGRFSVPLAASFPTWTGIPRPALALVGDQPFTLRATAWAARGRAPGS